MPTRPPDEVADLVEFLRGRLDWSNVPADPAALEVDFANYDGGVDTPGVRVHSPEVDLMRAGATGYSAMAPGLGPTQDVRTTVQVDAWGGTINDEADLNAHPEVVAAELRSEIWAAINAAGERPAGYQYLSVLDTTSGNDTEADPTEFRQIVFVGLGYELRPPE